MKMKVLLSTVMVILISLSFSSSASAQGCGPRGFYRGGGGYYGSPRVVVAVRPPVRYCPPPRYHGYRAYPRYRHYGYGGGVCARGHRGCNDRGCYGGNYRQRNYDRYDGNGYRNDRDDYRNDRYNDRY